MQKAVHFISTGVVLMRAVWSGSPTCKAMLHCNTNDWLRKQPYLSGTSCWGQVDHLKRNFSQSLQVWFRRTRRQCSHVRKTRHTSGEYVLQAHSLFLSFFILAFSFQDHRDIDMLTFQLRKKKPSELGEIYNINDSQCSQKHYGRSMYFHVVKFCRI